MTQAIEVVQNKEMNVSQAAKQYKVPRKSLENRVKARVVHGTLPGPWGVLSNEEKLALVEYVKYMAKEGFLMTFNRVCYCKCCYIYVLLAMLMYQVQKQ